jgi:hypothetical protein
MELIDSIADGFDLAKKLGFVLLVQHDPVLDVRHELQGMQSMDGLIEIDPNRIELLSEGNHICQKVIDALVPVLDVDGLIERYPAHVIAEVPTSGLPEVLLEGIVFGLVEPGIDPFVADLFFFFHGRMFCGGSWAVVFSAADFGGSGRPTPTSEGWTRSNGTQRVTLVHLAVPA